jgi:hypothetical protein
MVFLVARRIGCSGGATVMSGEDAAEIERGRVPDLVLLWASRKLAGSRVAADGFDAGEMTLTESPHRFWKPL